MKEIILPMIVSSCLLAACQKKPLHQAPDLGFNATVMQKGMDCGNSYLVKFDSTVQGLLANDLGFVYYEINLPEQFKIAGKRINVDFRKPDNNESMACTTLGPSYPQIYITKVNAFGK